MSNLTREDEARLEAIAAREQLATDAPWPESCLRFVKIKRWLKRTGAERADEDISFISSARDDIPWLLGLVAKIRESSLR